MFTDSNITHYKTNILTNLLKMKTIQLLFVVMLIFLRMSIHAQNVVPENNSAMYFNRCGQVEYENFLREKDPMYDIKRQEAEKTIAKKINEMNNARQSGIPQPQSQYIIPIVFHVLYNTTAQNISDAQVQYNLNQLNQDWSRTNTDASNTPSAWQSIAANMNVTFCLATQDPSGAPTTGIIHKSTTVTSFSSNDYVKSSAQGGDDPWDNTKYLNIWICNLGGGLLGYSAFPPVTSTWGAVIYYTTVGSLAQPNSAGGAYGYGRTLSHNVGHCFNLYHTWGDDAGACTGTDYVSDTPNMADATYGCPSGVVTDACGAGSDGSPGSNIAPGRMYQDFMDYTDDMCYNMFTTGQRTRVQSAITSYLMTVANNSATACSASPSLSVSIIGGNNSICNGNSDSLFASVSGGTSPYNYSWSTGQTDALILTSPTSTTTYTVTVTTGSLVATATTVVTVNSVSATITGNTSICSGQNTTLSASGGATYSWNTGVTTTSIIVNPTVLTTYTLTSATASCVAKATTTVTVNQLPTVSISGNTTICLGQNTTLSASGGGTYLWNTGPTTSAITVMSTAFTTNSYSVTVSNGNCSSVASVAVTGTYPTANFTSNTPLCLGDPAVFTDLSTGGISSWYWNFGDGEISNSQSPSHAYSVAGTYTASLTATSQYGCKDSLTQTVAVNPKPASSFMSNTPVCLGVPTVFTDGSTGGVVSWSWTFGEGGNSTLQNPAFTYTSASTYTVAEIVTNQYVCKDSSTKSVTVMNGLNVNLTLVQDISNPLLWNVYDTITGGTAPFTYLWNFGDGNTSTLQYPSHTYSVSGHYAISLTVTDANGCISSVDDSTYRISSAGIIQYVIVVDPLVTATQNLQFTNDISIFPNPSNGSFIFNCTVSKGELEIYNVMGEKVYSSLITNQSTSINIDAPNGIYFLQLKTEQVIATKKIAINK